MSDLIERMDAVTRLMGDRPAVLTDSATIRHQKFQETATIMAAALQHLGIQKGDRVALYAANGMEFALLYVAVVRAGAVLVPVNLLINPREIAYILKDAGVRALLVQTSLLPRVKDILQDLEALSVVVEIEESQSPFENLKPLLSPEGGWVKPSIDPDEDLVVILYTSGTTGFPKGAMLTHANLVANADSVHVAMRWRRGIDRVLVVLPMFHAFAATVGLWTPLMNGCALIPIQGFDPEGMARTIDRHQATIFLGVPSLYSVLLKLRDDRVRLFQTLRFGIAGGAAMPVSVLEAFQKKFGIRVYEGDGPTECSPVTCVNPIDGVSKPGTVGLPVPGVEMRIVDDEGLPLKEGEVGEIAVRGRNVMKGYWNQPEATLAVMRGDWLLTGDLGTQDADGYFSIVDRKKDLIIVNGMNVYPRMLEDVLYTHPAILEAAVIGEPDSRHGEVPVAYIACHEGHTLCDQELREFCRNHLGRHQVPRRFVLLERLPRNGAGKILKRELRKEGERERGVSGL